jgi:hypothetical protein
MRYFPATGEPTAGDQRGADHRSEDDAHEWRDEVVLEGILHEKNHAEEED